MQLKLVLFLPFLCCQPPEHTNNESECHLMILKSICPIAWDAGCLVQPAQETTWQVNPGTAYPSCPLCCGSQTLCSNLKSNHSEAIPFFHQALANPQQKDIPTDTLATGCLFYFLITLETVVLSSSYSSRVSHLVNKSLLLCKPMALTL